ncbi:MAG: DUF3187 family protein [Leptospiraceae bacterium]|nr:DUF3187 family protein [Leptospiraceae bacterium]MCP5494620.1 DUF3187 family protein [Leptospiraceae bacterium]
MPTFLTIVFIFFLSFMTIHSESSKEPFGPLEIHNMYTPLSSFLSMTPTASNTTPYKKINYNINTAWTSNMQTNNTMTQNIEVDMEVISLNVAAEYGLTENSDIRFDFWAMHNFSGIMDGAVRDFHRTFGFPNGDRVNHPDFKYNYKFNDCGKDVLDYHTLESLYSLKSSYLQTKHTNFLPIFYKNDPLFPFKNNLYDCGNKVLDVPSGTGLGDSNIRYKRKLKSESNSLPAFSTIIALRIPIGESNFGYRSGTEIGWGIVLQKSFNPLNIYFNLSYIYPSKRSFFNSTSVKIQPYFDGSLSFEYLWKNELSFILQFIYLTSPFQTKLKELGANSTQVSFGITKKVDENLKFYGAFTEDLSYYTTPDFSFHFGIRYFLSPLIK